MIVDWLAVAATAIILAGCAAGCTVGHMLDARHDWEHRRQDRADLARIRKGRR